MATNVGFNDTGWTYNYTAVAASAKVMIALVLEKGETLPSQIGFTFADFTDDSFTDWAIDESLGVNYDSYLRTAFTAADNQMFFMQAPYIYTFLENETPNTDDESADTDSLLLRGAWDWSNSADSHKWSRSTQVYKYRANNLVATSRTKMRGRGRVLQLRFDSEEGKDFKLLGWGIPIRKNSEP